MAFMNSINIIGSGLTAQQLRLDIVSENVTNSQTTRVENGEGAYRRKVVVFEAQEQTRMDDNGVNVTDQMVEMIRNAYQQQYVYQAVNKHYSILRMAVRGQ